MDLWAALAEERGALLDTFEALTGDQWDVPSLCGEWTVRQVLGHLVLAADPPNARFRKEMLRTRGSFNQANARLAVQEAARPLDELLADYRALRTTRLSPPGFGPEAPYTDAMLHHLDVRVPLGLPDERPADRYLPALELLLSRKAVLGFAPLRRPRLRWVATDQDWSGGQGDEVRGRTADLALAASGRRAGVDALEGPGVTALAGWLSG